MRWPRGRFNGKRIDGFGLQFRLHLRWWHWKPRASWNLGQPYLLWLCFTLRAEPSYE